MVTTPQLPSPPAPVNVSIDEGVADLPARLEAEQQQPSTGVVYFGYHEDPAVALKYLATIETSMGILKSTNPTLKVAVATNAVVDAARREQSPADDFVLIPQSDVFPGRQVSKFKFKVKFIQ